jgi:hypothetical protein
MPFIFKGLLDKFHPECPVAYCGIGNDGTFVINTCDGWWTDEKVQPATKEQRDFLFKKMKEAGYEWDPHTKKIIEVTMATIDYKEKYMQALERARQFSEKPYLEDSAGIVEYIFPELKESEDEKMRKSLIETFSIYYKDQPDTEWDGKPVKVILAWLEKQGKEIIPLEEIILNVWELGNYWKELTKGVCNTEHGRQLDYIVKHWKEGEHYIKSFEKQGEKKPEIDSYSLPISDDSSLPTLDESIYHPCTESVHEQESSEWSEEDESHIRYLIECLEHCKKGVALTMTTSTSQEYINWLKSLRPQSQWEPSDEQMEYLAKAILTLGNEGDCKTASILNELRTDLKKL